MDINDEVAERVKADVAAQRAPSACYTHDVKGGMYRMLGVGKHKGKGDGWRAAVFYADWTTGALYSTTVERWNTKFSEMPGPGYINQD